MHTTERPPLFGNPASPVKLPPSRFTRLQTLYGFQVIDHDGRPVLDCPNETIADDAVVELNNAAQNGSRALARAIGRLGSDPLIAWDEGDDE